MAISREEIIAQIDLTIKANGNGQITGPLLNSLFKQIVELVPNNSVPDGFQFPAAPALTNADKGKLVMNDGGFAKVAMMSGNSGVKGKWTLEPQDAATPFVATQPRTIQVIYTTGAGMAADGDTFTFTRSDGAVKVFTFRNMAMIYDSEVGIGLSVDNTIDNLRSKIVMFLGGNSSEVEFSPGQPFYIHDFSPTEGLNLSATWDCAIFTDLVVISEGVTGTTTPGSFAYETTEFFKHSGNTNVSGHETFSANLYFSQILDTSAPAGIVTGSYKYPQNAAEFADNIMWALDTLTLADGSMLYKDWVTITRVDNTITIEEQHQANNVYFNMAFSSLAPVSYNVLKEPAPVLPAYVVKSPLLGVLVGVKDGLAYIDRNDLIQVTLNKDLRFQTDDGNKAFAGNIFFRLLKPVDNGRVEPIFPDATPDGYISEFNTYGSSYYTDSNKNVNSTAYYEALQEGDAGEEIFVRRFTFLISQQDEFVTYDSYNGYGYYDDYYY